MSNTAVLGFEFGRDGLIGDSAVPLSGEEIALIALQEHVSVEALGLIRRLMDDVKNARESESRRDFAIAKYTVRLFKDILTEDDVVFVKAVAGLVVADAVQGLVDNGFGQAYTLTRDMCDYSGPHPNSLRVTDHETIINVGLAS